MSAIEELIEKTMDNYRKIESGERSLTKGKALNESANIVIRLALLQMNQCPEKAKSIEEANKKLLKAS
jgi:hypothetical protein